MFLNFFYYSIQIQTKQKVKILWIKNQWVKWLNKTQPVKQDKNIQM